MDKGQAINSFFNSFGLKAYDATTVPENAAFPYITYELETGDLDAPVTLTASLWDRGTSWETISKKSDIIAKRIAEMYPIKFDGGYVQLAIGTPYSQRMGDENDNTIRRIVLNIQAEYLSAY